MQIIKLKFKEVTKIFPYRKCHLTYIRKHSNKLGTELIGYIHNKNNDDEILARVYQTKTYNSDILKKHYEVDKEIYLKQLLLQE